METLTRPGLASFVGAIGGRAACLALSRDPNAKLTILLFPPGADRPAFVVKVPTSDVAARSVEREAARLTELADLADLADLAGGELGAVSGTVPRVVALLEHLGRTVLVTTALPGRSMLAGYHSWRHTARRGSVAADFAAAGAWLSAFHLAVDARRTEPMGPVAEAIRARFGGREGVAEDAARAEDLRRRLAGFPVPAGVVHGDFWPGNLLVRDGAVSGVIDWEMARLDGPATADLARFVTAYSLYLDRHTRPGRRVPGHEGLRAGRWGSGVDYVMNGTGWYPALARAFVREGLERLGVPGSCWRDVLLADLVAIAAEADHGEFAWNHLLAFRRLRP
jgi:aminoglycoside phosphotransferase (APT) family kinase protein